MKIRQAQEADAAGISHVHVDSWRTTYAGIVADNILAGLSYERRETIWRTSLADSQQFIFVAENDAGNIVGFACGGPERGGDPLYKGELYAIYLLAECQGKGIGKQLAQAVAKKLAEKDFTAMLVWVLAKNPSRRFYEALGGQELYQKEIILGDAVMVEVAYGWKTLEELLNQA